MNSPRIRIDHFVIVARDVDTSLDFYERVLGADVRDRVAWHAGEVEYPVLHFGRFKINVHPVETPAAPRALSPLPGSVDIAFEWEGDVAGAADHLRANDVEVILGPVPQEGARGVGRSVYFRDPDGSLLELICYPGSSDQSAG
jgi:catechol 2,3-dioxygenase-like lactoylglutathione lyase family enzyme